MKILVINWQDIRNPLAGGAEVQFQEVFKRVVALGHDVTLLCSSFPGASAEDRIDGIRVIRRGGRALFNYAVPRMYREAAARDRYDVVVDDLNKIPFFTPRFVREPICGLVHHLFGTSIFREIDPLQASYVWSMERTALEIYRRRNIPFMAVSPSTLEELRLLGFEEGRLHLVPLAVDHVRFRPDPAARSAVPLLGYVGRVKRYKSIDVLLRAFVSVHAGVPQARLVIVGDGDDRRRLESLAGALGIADDVHFTGFVPEAEKVGWLQKIWCMITPSSKEGWGLTVTEANACGTPVIASDVPGLRDAVRDGETGLLVPYGKSEALAQAILVMLRDHAQRNTMGRAGEAFAAQFTWDNAAAKTLSVLDSVAGARD